MNYAHSIEGGEGGGDGGGDGGVVGGGEGGGVGLVQLQEANYGSLVVRLEQLHWLAGWSKVQLYWLFETVEQL